MLEIIILSFIQGITEFIPVSSSAHLILASEFLEINKNNLTLDVSMHFGSFLAIVYFFYTKINNFLKNKLILIKIIISSIPVSIFGIFLIKLNLLEFFRNYYTVSWATILFGILLFVSNKNKSNKTIEKDFSFKAAIIIGFFQILSLIPGTSRSGITLTSARFMNFNIHDSVKISFLTSVPVLLYASCFNLFRIINEKNFTFSILNLIALLSSFLFSYITIKYFLKFLSNFSLNLFVAYRIVLGSFILMLIYA